MPKVLIANRGEIAIRIIRSAQELGWTTVAIYCGQDTSHAAFADETIELDDVSWFMSVERMIEIAKRTQSTHIHPGYGFLSENASFAEQLSSSSVTFIGPSQDTLRIAGDKMLSRDLAVLQGVSVALGKRVSSTAHVRAFIDSGVGYPVMIKALDGGGGRGIRVVSAEDGIEEAFKRCLGESPSQQLFVEKAMTGPGWKHIEVQIVGDGTGEVSHLWERECSVQRRFQKVVEMAPSTLSRNLVEPVLAASIKMARHLCYKGLGTFEYLVNANTRQWVFLEINPRIQVEHTVTEEISNLDLVRIQLLLSQPSTTLTSLSLTHIRPPQGHAIQLRLTAEDPAHAFRLSVGVIHPADMVWPGGHGVRIDTWLSGAIPCAVSTDFDSLLAKLVVRGANFEEATQRAVRALRELKVGGITTNVDVLAGVVAHRDWAAGDTDTTWLERKLDEVLQIGKEVVRPKLASGVAEAKTNKLASGSLAMQPGAIFHLTLSPTGSKAQADTKKHTMTLSSIAHNNFPEHLSGTLQTTLSPLPLAFSLKQSVVAGVSSSSFDLADPNDRTHVASPLTGKIVELHPALSDEKRLINKGDTLAVLSVMKMESVVTAPWTGLLQRRGKGVEVGVVVGEGMLLAVISDEQDRSRL